MFKSLTKELLDLTAAAKGSQRSAFATTTSCCCCCSCIRPQLPL